MTCKKIPYERRRGAVRARRRQPGKKGLRPYRCPTCGYWHLGHLPAAIIAGDVGRGDVYPGRLVDRR